MVNVLVTRNWRQRSSLRTDQSRRSPWRKQPTYNTLSTSNLGTYLGVAFTPELTQQPTAFLNRVHLPRARQETLHLKTFLCETEMTPA